MDLRSLFDDEFLDGVRKDVAYEVRMVVKTLSDQISSTTSPGTPSYQQAKCYFSTRFYNQAKELGLTEEDALDVFENGEEVKEGIIAREFDGYEIGIEYVQEHFSGKPVITAIWKRNITA